MGKCTPISPNTSNGSLAFRAEALWMLPLRGSFSLPAEPPDDDPEHVGFSRIASTDSFGSVTLQFLPLILLNGDGVSTSALSGYTRVSMAEQSKHLGAAARHPRLVCGHWASSSSIKPLVGRGRSVAALCPVCPVPVGCQDPPWWFCCRCCLMFTSCKKWNLEIQYRGCYR